MRVPEAESAWVEGPGPPAAAAITRAQCHEATIYSLRSAVRSRVSTCSHFTAVGALVLAGAGDAMFLVLGVLISSLGAFWASRVRSYIRATEASMKYFVFGSVSEATMIFGLTFWFVQSNVVRLLCLLVDRASRLLSAGRCRLGDQPTGHVVARCLCCCVRRDECECVSSLPAPVATSVVWRGTRTLRRGVLRRS